MTPPDPDGPSTPVPAVPLLSELLLVFPENQLLPTPVAVELNVGNSDALPLETTTVPGRTVGSSKILSNDKNHPPTELPQGKKLERWKATQTERRKVTIVQEKTPGK